MSATIGTRHPLPWARSAARIARLAAYPSISGIWQSMNTTSYGSRAIASTASRPLATASTRHPAVSSIRITTRWLTALSSATSTRSRRPGAPAAAGAGTAGAGATGGRPASTRLSSSRSRVGRTGLVRYAAIPAARAPSAVVRPHAPSISTGIAASRGSAPSARASASPSCSGRCMSSSTAS